MKKKFLIVVMIFLGYEAYNRDYVELYPHCSLCKAEDTLTVAQVKKKELKKEVKELKKLEKYPQEIDGKVKFIYEGKAKKVAIAGSFNDWDAERDFLKEVKPGVFEITLPLSVGRYEYKFVVDGNWICDPKNPNKVTTPDGFENSVVLVTAGLDLEGPIITEKFVKFCYYAPKAKEVYLCGDFNNWMIGADPMKKDKKGLWCIEKELPPGIYKYKFVVDGEWIKDPFGVSAYDEYDNSLLRYVPEGLELGPKIISRNKKIIVEFVYYAPDAKEVYLCGDFNKWRKGADPMKKEGKVWKVVKELEPKNYKYKFIVDGSWTKDPFGKSANDEYDNSIIELE